MNYFIYTSHHFTPHGKIWTQLIDLAPNVWLHRSVSRASHRYRGGHGFESSWSPDFFRLLLSNCLNWKIYCDDRSSLSSTTAVQIWIISDILYIELKTVLQSVEGKINELCSSMYSKEQHDNLLYDFGKSVNATSSTNGNAIFSDAKTKRSQSKTSYKTWQKVQCL